MNHFSNDVEAQNVAGLTIENGIGTVTLHGAMTLSPDRDSLDLIRALRQKLDEIENSAVRVMLAKGSRDMRPRPEPLEQVDNPF